MRHKKHPLAFAPLMVALGCLVLGAASGPQGDPGSWTRQRWLEWRDEQIAKILRPEIGCTLSRKAVVERCVEASAFLESHYSITRDQAMANFTSFVRAQAQMAKPGYSLGMEISDLQYWRSSAPMLAFPPLLKNQEFLKAMSSPEGYARAVGLIEKQNEALPEDQKWVVAPFEAQFVKSVDKSTYGRLLVLVPEAGVDKWILFAIASPDTREPGEVKSVSMVAVQREAGSSKSYLMDFMRQRDKETGKVGLLPTATMGDNPSQNCYDCHKSGVVPIHPLKEYRFDSVGRLVCKEPNSPSVIPELNSRIRGYGSQDRVFQNLKAYGPSLAPKGLARSLQFVQEATKEMDLSVASHQRIRAAMTCGGCHQDFAPINYPQAVQTHGDKTAFRRREGLVQTYVEKGWMPPNNKLTPEERKGLWRCLMKEYLDPERGSGVLIDWLRGTLSL